MSETTKDKTAEIEREMVARLTRSVERQIRRHEGIVQNRMESIARDFNECFEWASEQIYKSNLMLDFLKQVRELINEKECTIDALRFFLGHAKEHAADDIMHRDPYSGSSNGATNLAHRWEYETYRNIYHLSGNLLDNLIPDDDDM